MNSAIMITLALTTISCFANGDVVDGNIMQNARTIQSKLETLINDVTTKQKEFNATVKADWTERLRVWNSSISSANTNILAYATAARKNGKKVNETCQSKFDDDVNRLMRPGYEKNFTSCVNSQTNKFKAIFYVNRITTDVLKPLLNGSSTEPASDQATTVRNYDYLKQYADEHIFATDKGNSIVIQKARDCFNTAEEQVKESIEKVRKSTEDCIDKDGAL